MSWFVKLITNPFLVTSISSWFVAQVLKVIINFFIQKKIVWERLIGDGGMPSGHSATVSSLALFTALRCGPDSVQFALAAVFAIVVCHDATGVRMETGKQTQLLKEITQLLDFSTPPDIKLKELVGHTPLQVLAGVTIGLCNACLMHFLVF